MKRLNIKKKAEPCNQGAIHDKSIVSNIQESRHDMSYPNLYCIEAIYNEF